MRHRIIGFCSKMHESRDAEIVDRAPFPTAVPSAFASPSRSPDRASQNAAPSQNSIRNLVWEPVVTCRGATADINAIAIAPDGKVAISASDDRSARAWDLATGESIFCFLGSDRELYDVAFHPNGKAFYTAGFDCKIAAWSLEKQKFLKTFLDFGRDRSHKGYVCAVAVHPEGRVVASGGADKLVKLWTAAGDRRRNFTGHGDSVLALCYTPDGRYLASGSADKTIKIWDACQDRWLRDLTGHFGWVTAIAAGKGGRLLASGSTDKTVRLWDAKTGTAIGTLEGHQKAVTSVAFSADGALLASASRSEVCLWSLQSGKLQHQLDGRSPVALSPGGNAIVTGGDRFELRVWQPAQGLSGPWYAVLDVAPNASAAEVKRAYYRLAKAYHPDRNASPEARSRMQAIARAYQEYGDRR